MKDTDLHIAITRDLATMETTQVSLDLPFSTAFVMLASLQVAWRFRSHQPAAHHLLAQAITALTAQIAVTPALREVVRRGMDPRFDVERTW